MSELTAEQHEMLERYDELLSTISEGLKYLEDHMKTEETPMSQQVFQDVLLSLEQISRSHDQMEVFFKGNEELQALVIDFHGIVNHLQGWFEHDTAQEKHHLLVEHVVPAFESWRTRMEAFVKPYTAH
ncbi:hypothetical protein VKA52_03380 [Halobacillus sp. HZG1]|uniref:hypothetical protein n=1 Tax=Halobacillus sp. HZG1 TaxID=3111769 RepID=UPI002DB5A436|nr:hypothetical protein [Halobacillus sp. HZG1]MEC3882768.1 hypothetical protein [Halobacillus sp. HZG1]